MKSKRGPTPVVRRVAVVLVRAAAGAGPGAAWEGDGAGWEVLVVRRPGGVIWEHMWEFPALEVTEKQWSHLEKTGRADSPKKGVSGNNRGATTGRGGSTKAISRFNWLTHFADEVHERLGICVELDDWQAAVGHQLTHRTMDYRVLRGRVPESACEPRLPRCDAGGYAGFRWVRVGVPAGLPMSRAAGKIAAAAGIGEPAPFPPR